MTTSPTPEETTTAWPLAHRILFRFFVVYWLLQTTPWNWFSEVPGVGAFAGLYGKAVGSLVPWANAHVFHVRPELVLPNGSGDTSWSWTALCLYLSVAGMAAVAWSALDRKRLAYPRALYWLRTMLRFYLALFALSYGIIKVFALQMPFPSLSQLATPLGDFLPMRLSWLFIGYSTKYEVFSGVMETVAGLLLLWRPTVTLGLFAATGAFLNVVMINLSYDVPVKLFASHLLFACLFLLVLDSKRLLTLLVLNKPVAGTSAYEPPASAPWLRWARWVLKGVVVVLFLVLPFKRGYDSWQSQRHTPPARPFARGVYDVRLFVRGGDTVPALAADTTRWRDVIFDSANQGSVGSTDALFWQRYRRGYFRYKADSASRLVTVWRSSFKLDSTFLFTMKYEMPDTNTIRFWTKVRDDSVFVELARSPRHFQLAERQFHWLSEYNR